jgi:hypothetical protein
MSPLRKVQFVGYHSFFTPTPKGKRLITNKLKVLIDLDQGCKDFSEQTPLMDIQIFFIRSPLHAPDKPVFPSEPLVGTYRQANRIVQSHGNSNRHPIDHWFDNF